MVILFLNREKAPEAIAKPPDRLPGGAERGIVGNRFAAPAVGLEGILQGFGTDQRRGTVVSAEPGVEAGESAGVRKRVRGGNAGAPVDVEVHPRVAVVLHAVLDGHGARAGRVVGREEEVVGDAGGNKHLLAEDVVERIRAKDTAERFAQNPGQRHGEVFRAGAGFQVRLHGGALANHEVPVANVGIRRAGKRSARKPRPVAEDMAERDAFASIA